MRKRLFAVLLCVCLLVGLVPTAAFAAGTDTGKVIQLGIGGITGYAATNSYDYIYFGNWEAPDEYTTSGPLKWRVLDTKTNMDNATEGDGLFLLSEATLGISGQFGGVYFQNSYHSYTGSDGLSFHKGRAPSDGDHTDCLLMNAWQGSEAQDWCKTFYSRNLTPQEQSAVLATTKSDAEFTSSVYQDLFTASENILSGDKIFFLSAGEAETEEYGFDDATRRAKYGERTQYWRLRSPCSCHGTRVGGVTGYGRVSHTNAQDGWTVRPAFNLDLNSVLFTSAADGGKSSGAVGASSLQAVSDYSGTEWKLTLLDTNRSFSANVDGQTSVPASAGDNVQITYSGAQTGDNEYVSVLLCDSSDNVLYYGNIAQNSENGTVAINIPLGLAAGSYTLKVFSEQCNGDYKTDYASAFQNIKLEIAGLPQETTPSAEFTATGDNGGTLSNVDTSMKYSVDGGNTWNDITGEPMAIIGVTEENDVKVYKPGDGTTTSDSEVQTIDVTQAAQPTSIDKADCTTPQQNDGQITGVDTTMEYRLSGDSDWTAVAGNSVTGLTNGTYEIRVKASGTVLASNAATVTIGEHTCAAQGEWQYDGTAHWKFCACGAKVEKAAHSGGTATCMASAVCEVCGQPYGEKNSNNHIGTEAWITTETTHTKVYSCCQAVTGAETAHTWENGKCSVCQYDCKHQGGTATCSQLAQCELCGSLYGDYDENNHKAADAWTQENGKHYHICEYGCNTHLNEAECSGGTATCTNPAVCATCKQTYGAVNPNNHAGKAVWTQTATTHSSAYGCCGTVEIAEENHEWKDGVCSECGYKCQHSGGKATCTEQATCEICNEKYGATAHKLSFTAKVEETCTTDGKEGYYTCEVCGKYFEDEAGNTEITSLNEWGIIPAAGHEAGTVWKSDGNGHWKECVNCGNKMNEAAHAYEWVTDKKPTATEAGSRHEECKICGYAKAAVEISATGTAEKPAKPSKPGKTPSGSSKDTNTSTGGNRTGGSTSPKTGDNSNLTLWFALLLESGASVAAVAVHGRRRRKR